MPQSSRNLAVLAIVLAIAGLGAIALRGRTTRPATHQAARSNAAGIQATSRAQVTALGRLEPGGGILDVGGAAGERIDRLMVAEGDMVKAGQELAFLGSYPLRQSEHELAKIQLAEARSRAKADLAYGAALVAEAQAAQEQLNLAALDLDALRAKSKALELNLQIARRDQQRLDGAKELVSPQEQDHQQLLVEQAQAEYDSSRAQLAKLAAAQGINQREARARLETAQANQHRLESAIQLESLEKAVTTAAQKVELAIVRAPRDGRILRILTRAGETIAGRPVLQLGDTDHMCATAEIYETDVRFVRAGQRATVTSAALSGPLAGTVESVGVTVAKNAVMSLDPTAAADARVIVARIRLAESSEASRLVDLQVDVSIETGEKPAADESASVKRGE